MIAYFLRLALSPLAILDRWASRHIAAMVAEALADTCPDFIEPPEPAPDEYDRQELKSEVVLDAAAERLWETGPADFEAWEDERIGGTR